MYDELTKVDIEKIQKELDDRCKLRQKLIRDVQTAREFGDLSENFEYRPPNRKKIATKAGSVTCAASCEPQRLSPPNPRRTKSACSTM